VNEEQRGASLLTWNASALRKTCLSTGTDLEILQGAGGQPPMSNDHSLSLAKAKLEKKARFPWGLLRTELARPSKRTKKF
jgi:hypothetical protein